MPLFSRLQDGRVSTLDLLRDALGTSDSSDSSVFGKDEGVGDVQVALVQHHGHAVRGVKALTAIPPGGLILRSPEKFHLTKEDVNVPLRLRAVRDQAVTTGLWLAEQKVHPQSKLWSTFTKALPTLEEFRNDGLPLSASEADLARLSHLPEVGPMAKWIQRLRSQLQIDFLRYIKALRFEKQTCPMPGTDEWLPEKPMSYEDALWGTIATVTRAFSRHTVSDVDYLVPGADLFNHHRNANAGVGFDEPDGDFVVRATEKIEPGEEITIDYDQKADPLELWMRYGVPPVRTGFAPHSCKVLCGADFGQGPFPKNVKTLVDQRCKCNIARQADGKHAVVQPENQELSGEPKRPHGSVAAARFL